jgi:hypothetical protein
MRNWRRVDVTAKREGIAFSAFNPRRDLPSSFFLLPSSFFLLPSSFFLLPSSFFLLPSAFCLLPSDIRLASAVLRYFRSATTR